MKSDFEIPFDIKHDLAYCQRALANHILLHQKISTFGPMMNIPSSPMQKSLQQIENEIMDIGQEQKLIFNRLRFFIDYYLMTKTTKIAERQRLTNWVSKELAHYAQTCGADIRPMNVQQRLCADELYDKYYPKCTDDLEQTEQKEQQQEKINKNGDFNTMQTKVKLEPNDELAGEVMEVLLSPEDIGSSLQTNYQQQQHHLQNQQLHQQKQQQQRKQESLLKPKAERISLPKDEPVNANPITITTNGNKSAKKSPPKNNKQPVAAPQQAISLSRLKLIQALCKAKDDNEIKSSPEEIRHQTDSPDTVTCITEAPKLITISSSSQSSNSSSSDDMFDSIDMMKEDQEPTVMGKEPFLRLFGLYTYTYSNYLRNRRPQRKRRNCTSTERGDFHYGKLDLFEKQYANKRNKRQFLYSPPATRAKRQRRAISNGDTVDSLTTTSTSATSNNPVIVPKRVKGVKSNASSSSSIASAGSNNSDKVCVTCFKRNNLLECKTCFGTYHTTCHLSLTDQIAKDNMCPYCWRQKRRSNNVNTTSQINVKKQINKKNALTESLSQ